MSLEHFKLFIIGADATIQQALVMIEENKYQTLIVADERLRVMGTLTDGDIRKALINKRSLLAPVYDVMNTAYKAVINKDQARAIFDKHFYINLVPIVTPHGILADIAYRDK